MLKRLLSKDLKHLDSWLDRWKNRCDVPFKTVSGEGILSKDKLKEIYNADIFSLFLFTQSDKSLDLRFEACVADEKKFLTRMAAANATGYIQNKCCHKKMKMPLLLQRS